MLSSLPLLLPSDPNDLWYTPLSAPTSNASLFASNSSNPNDPHTRQQHHHSHQSHHNAHHYHPRGRAPPPPRTLLSDLRNDENAIMARKSNIRRFGAGWLKPPGINKTLQALEDEKAEREEQELNAQREAALAEAQAAQEEAIAEARRQQLEAEGVPGGERDLDADIPEIDIITLSDNTSEIEREADRVRGLASQRVEGIDDDDAWTDEGSDDAGMGVEGDGDYAGGTFGMRSRMSAGGRHMGRMSINISMDGAGGDLGMDADLDAGMEEGEERDLDDDVPEAGDYEHTDTEAEDEDDDTDEESMRMTPAQRAAAVQGSAGIMGSSVFGSSPAGHLQYGRRSMGGGGVGGNRTRQ